MLLEFSDTAFISLEEQLDDFRISHVTPHILRHILAEFWTFGEKKTAFGFLGDWNCEILDESISCALPKGPISKFCHFEPIFTNANEVQIGM